MPKVKKEVGDCCARLVPDSPADHFVRALRKIHDAKGEPLFTPFEEILKEVPETSTYVIRDFENGVVDQMISQRIIEMDVEDFTFRIHPDHWLK